LQQNRSSDELPFCCKTVGSAFPIAPRLRRRSSRRLRRESRRPGEGIPASNLTLPGTTCNIRNEPSSHVTPLAIEVSPGKQSAGFWTREAAGLSPQSTVARRAR